VVFVRAEPDFLDTTRFRVEARGVMEELVSSRQLIGAGLPLPPERGKYTVAILDAARHISKGAGTKLEEYPGYEMEVQGT
jgi:hypothetical protein